ncbi:MAG TPA: AraC family transcriptional regulator ligand-binding domain-containing protein [Polyangiaceae bacterium]|nr:AraC family transcriptional regulator ligand-binding domain-containing protein [Polyangiaceae bacterium]
MPAPLDAATPNVPGAYVRLTAEIAEARGVAREKLLSGLGIEPSALDEPDLRIPLLTYGHVIWRALKLTGDPGLGIEFGLRANLTTHGLVGFGVMSHRTLKDALVFEGKYFGPLRSPGFTSRFFYDGDQAVVEFREAVQFGPLRQYSFDMCLVGFTHLVSPFVPLDEMELRFEGPEPPYFKDYASRLPRTLFNQSAHEARFPASRMDRPVATANPVSAALVTRECDREMALFGHDDRVLERVRALIVAKRGEYPGIEGVAKKLGMSGRTLKRRLQERDFTFRELVEEARREESLRLLSSTRLSVEVIGRRVGYTSHSNFIRAFKKWTKKTPAEYRDRMPQKRRSA